MLCLHDSIRHDDPSVPRLLRAVEDAPSLTALILAAWQVARVRTVHLVEAVLAERARRPTAWPPCPAWGVSLRRKGCAPRQMTSLCGPIRWPRRVGRGPQGCVIPQVAPVDDALGGEPPQRTSEDVQSLGCALAVCVPCAPAARWRGWDSGGPGSPRAVWGWGHAAGQRAMEQLHEQGQALAPGHLPTEEPLAAALTAAPLLRGADGGMVPFRPEGGHPRGTTAWHEVKGGLVARVGRQGTRTGTVVTRRPQRRVVAVVGASDALRRRLGFEALRQGIRRAPQVVWRSDGAQGLWHRFEACCARQAPGIVDLSHAAQPLWKGAAAWLAGRTTQARRWCAWARHRLRPGMPDGVLADLAEALDVEGLPETARDTWRTV